MDPSLLRRTLRQIVRYSVPLATSAMIGCSDPALVSPDAGVKEVPSSSLEFASPTEPASVPDASPAPFVPRSNITCPYDGSPQSPSECRGKEEGVYQVFLPEDTPPLTFKECERVCSGKLELLCSDYRDSSVIVSYGHEVKSCEEKEQDGKRMLACEYQISRSCASVGRRPHGLRELALDEVHANQLQEDYGHGLAIVGDFFAELAYLEEAAVTAFANLTKELEHYDAPATLVEWSRQGIAEETEHAALMQLLAGRYGGSVREVEVTPFVLRPLLAIALENAIEGCVKESFGAVLGMWQSEHSVDPAVRAVMARVAYEESQHASLSWAIDKWVQPLLSAQERQEVEAAKARSLAALGEGLDAPVAPALVQHAGLPDRRHSDALFQAINEIQWT